MVDGMRLIQALARSAIASLVALALSGSMALAQIGESGSNASEEGEAAEAQEEAPVLSSNAPFMEPLNRLSEVLGSVHFLRQLCGDENADIWRAKAAQLIDAQAPNEADRRQLIASFNTGYRAFESTYRKCTPTALFAVERYMREGSALTKDIVARYGN